MNDALESLQITNGLQIRFEFIGMNATYVRRFLSVAPGRTKEGARFLLDPQIPNLKSPQILPYSAVIRVTIKNPTSHLPQLVGALQLN